MPAIFIIHALFNDAVPTVIVLSFENDDKVCGWNEKAVLHSNHVLIHC